MTAYTGDLLEEEDQSKVTLGGIILSSRRVITRAGSTMLVATLEDLQGSVEVVVFPRVFEETGPSWVNDSVVLVTGRIDRRDETPQILCEAVTQWDDAVRMGPVAYGAERDRLLTRGGRRWGNGQNGNGRGVGEERVQGVWSAPAPDRQAVAVEPDAAVAVAVEDLPPAVPEPAEEPPAPADAVPLQSAPEASPATVDVSIGEEVPADRLLGVIESVKSALAARPGPSPVVLNLSVAGAVRRVRLPDQVSWDDRLGDAIRRAAGVPITIELRPEIVERLA